MQKTYTIYNEVSIDNIDDIAKYINELYYQKIEVSPMIFCFLQLVDEFVVINKNPYVGTIGNKLVLMDVMTHHDMIREV